MDCRHRAHTLARLADQLPEYAVRLRQVGFECCHINDDWIERRCTPDDVAMHKRYLVEFAREVLATGNPSISSSDRQDSLSSWLNELKAQRRAKHGPYEALWKSVNTRHLEQLSPGWREFMRVRDSSSSVDRAKVADQVATFIGRQAGEIRAHGEAIASCRERLPAERDERVLQAFFSEELVLTLAQLGARVARTLVRNQVLQCDEETAVVIFDLARGCVFALLPSVVSAAKSGVVEGTLGVGFRLMTPTELAAPKFEFGRDIVLHLHELLPNKFNGYGRFTTPEEFCLNILAWAAALCILLPDVLQTLRAAATAPTPSQLH